MLDEHLAQILDNMRREKIEVSMEDRREALKFAPIIEPGEYLRREKQYLEHPNGKRLLEQPLPELVKALNAADKRIEYLPYEVPEGKSLPDNHLEGLYNKVVSPAVVKRIQDEFKDDLPVLVRGVSVSINGTVENPDVLIRDIRQVVNLGESQNREFTLLTPVTEGSETLGERTNQYLTQGPGSLARDYELNDEQAAAVFPVLLVYDKSKLTKTDGGYGYALPIDPEERKSIILKAYILDKPTE